jgi:hypothetical protein
MADRFPLIFNSTSNQIQELAAADNLDLSSSGITGVTSITASSTVTAADFNSTSDQNLKDNIRTIENALDKVSSINGVLFEWKSTGDTSAGVVAQEVEKVLPEVVKDIDGKTVNYNGLIGLLIEAIKEQQVQIEELKSQINNQ